MAGEISNLYGINAYNNPYLNNNDDFLAQQYFKNVANNPTTNTQGTAQPAFQGYQQPQVDTFQKSGSSLGTGLTLGGIAGLGTGAGIYYLGEGPVKDGKFADDILKAVDINIEEVSLNKAKELLDKKNLEILKKAGVPEGISLENLKAYSETGMPSAFPKIHEKLTQEQAKNICEAAQKEIDAIDIDALAKESVKLAEQETLQYKQDKLKNLQSQKTKLEALADDADLEKFFKDNAKSFGIEGDEKTIEAEAKKLAKTYKNKAGAIAHYSNEITSQETVVKTAKDTLNGKVAAYYDDTAKALKKDAPETLTKAFKNFKWNKAAKGGGIAAAAGLVLGCLFGSNA